MISFEAGQMLSSAKMSIGSDPAQLGLVASLKRPRPDREFVL